MRDWNGQRVVIVGAARQGLALARYLSTHGARVILNDNRSEIDLAENRQALAGLAIDWVTGGHPLEILDGADLVCVSGGVSLDLPLIAEARRRNLPLTNDSQIFIELVPCPTIGITGSAGKTTTTTLVGRMALAGLQSPAQAWVGGNIGLPLIGYLDQIKPEDLVILELSSFQLELMTRSPHVAAILNVTPNHLDRHKTMEAYTAAKARILGFQSDADVALLGYDDPGAWGLTDQVQGMLMSFSRTRLDDGIPGAFAEGETLWFTDGRQDIPLMPRSEIRLRGEHNLLNVLAACAISLAGGLPIDSLAAGVSGFNGVAHRLEFVRSLRGADWYNDSIATAPERSMAAIRSFEEPIVLLAGGRDKKLPWEPFAALIHQRVDHLVLFGEAADLIGRAVGPVSPGQKPYSIAHCDSLREAVTAAAEAARPGDVVLLSPGGTSFDEFIDFEQRGERFIQWVKELS
jgi:UDP-N-acetylmuramoylalanine--D-glutamate ligase